MFLKYTHVADYFSLIMLSILFLIVLHNLASSIHTTIQQDWYHQHWIEMYSSCCGHVDQLATEPFLLLHRKHGTGYRRSWNCSDRWTCLVVIWKHFCFILSTGTKIRIDSVMRPRSSSRGCSSASVTVTVTLVCGDSRLHIPSLWDEPVTDNARPVLCMMPGCQ